MYHYQPPKSSTWGHSLGKMDPRRERELCGKFLATAVAEYKDGGSSLTFVGPLAQMASRLEQMLGKPLGGVLNALAFEECERCREEMDRAGNELDAALAAGGIAAF